VRQARVDHSGEPLLQPTVCFIIPSNLCLTLNGLLCAHVPLRIYTLTKSHEAVEHWRRLNASKKYEIAKETY